MLVLIVTLTSLIPELQDYFKIAWETKLPSRELVFNP